jgi:hypothetical protein
MTSSRKEVTIMQLTVSLVDREGNKKAVSIKIAAADVARVPAFLITLQTLTGCKLLGYGTSESYVFVDGLFVEGNFDLVGEVANLRFKRVANGESFVFKIPGAIDSAYTGDEEVAPDFALLVKGALETLLGIADGLQYRGGRLITKEVSNPVKIPDLEVV